MLISFIIEGRVKAKQSFKYTRDGRKYTPRDVKDYAEYIKGCFIQKFPKFKPLETPLRVEIKAFFAPPKSWSKKKQDLALCGELKPTVKPDCDNLFKGIGDSLNGLAYKDDKQIIELKVSKSYAESEFVIIKIEEV